MPAVYTDPKTWAFQEGVESSELNTQLRDNLLSMGPHLIVRKTSDETVTSSSTKQDDDQLVLPVGVNEVWKFEFTLIVDAGPGGFASGVTFPSGGYVSALAWIVNNNVFNNFQSGTSPRSLGASGSMTAGDRAYSPIMGIYVNGGTAGNLQLQWAQSASNATGTIVKANSTLWAVKLA